MKKLLMVLLLTGCGATGPQGPQGSPGIVTTGTLQPGSIDYFVDTYNTYRASLGQEPITPGLSCNLYTVPTNVSAIVGATLTSVGSFLYTSEFNVPNESVSVGLNILPTVLQNVYQTYYIVKCTGYLVTTTDGWYEFDTSSDDGSNLYINGTLVVNNDGVHGIQTRSGVKFLMAQANNSFELDFLQATGNQALIVNMNEQLLPSNNLFH